jgi:hypothetical protein
MRFAIVTPSYYVDLEPCRWLCETLDRHVPDHVAHYLLVDRADLPLFAPLASPRRHVVTKEEVLGGRLRQLPFARRWWLGPRGRPVRGWIVQQLTKLFAHRVVDADVLQFVDSGAFFVRQFDPRGNIRDACVPLFRETGEYYLGDPSARWQRIAARLLGIRPVRNYDVGYVKTLVTWRRDNLVKLHEHLERVAGRPSLGVLAREITLSEYYLYGMYCDLILGDRAGHYPTTVTETLSHWTQDTLGPAELRRLRESLREEHVLVMVNEKSRTSIEVLRDAFRDP